MGLQRGGVRAARSVRQCVAAGFGVASLAATALLLRRQELQAQPALELDD